MQEGEVTYKRIHMCQDIRGALKNWKKKDYQTAFPTLSVDEAREHLLDCLAKGWKVLPFGSPCEGFSYQDGCPGHPMEPPPGPPEWAPPYLQVKAKP
jgi:hypothetical protein